MTLTDIFEIAASIIVSVGGAGAIILGLSKWFGGLIATRVLDNYRFKHGRDLENLKNQYGKQLEFARTELEKSKHQFLKYSDKQFDFYNKLWARFVLIKKESDALWERKSPVKLPRFANFLDSIKSSLFDDLLIIDKEHSDKLLFLINEFEKMKFREYQLRDLRKTRVLPTEPMAADDSSYDENFDEEGMSYTGAKKVVVLSPEIVAEALEAHKELKTSYDNELLALGDMFRLAMKGNKNEGQ